jgi:ferredoxin
MKIVIDWELCQGHGSCMGDAPEVFRVDDFGKLEVLMPTPPESMRQAVETAAQYCPTGAVSIEE